MIQHIIKNAVLPSHYVFKFVQFLDLLKFSHYQAHIRAPHRLLAISEPAVGRTVMRPLCDMTPFSVSHKKNSRWVF